MVDWDTLFVHSISLRRMGSKTINRIVEKQLRCHRLVNTSTSEIQLCNSCRIDLTISNASLRVFSANSVIILSIPAAYPKSIGNIRANNETRLLCSSCTTYTW